MKESTKHKIKVIARFRPLIKREKRAHAQSVWIINEEMACVKADKNAAKKMSKRASTVAPTPFVFDQVHDESSSTVQVYDSSVKKIVDNFCNGYNGTILAYGQTASGKTYTMSGAENDGIINMAIQQVFDYINNFKNRRFLVRVSFMEIYKEVFRDLLTGASPDTLYTDDNDNVMVRDMSELDIQDIDSLQKALNDGANRRKTGRTDMNEHSSRSHTIFRIILESVDDTEQILISHLNLVDLAGSERISDTGASGVTLKEAASINKSLTTLTLVINQITENSTFVNYRDSKLTHLLKSSLGGNAQTCMLICCTPADYTQTLQTLQFGSRAKTIENTCKQNTEISDGARIKQLEKELKELRKAADMQKDLKDDIGTQRLKNIEKFLFNTDKENKVVKKGGIRRQTLGGLKAGDDARTENLAEVFKSFKKMATDSKTKDDEATQESTQDQTNMSMGIFTEEDQKMIDLQDEVEDKQAEIEKLTGMLDDFKNTVRNQKITIQNLTDNEKNSMNESTAEDLMITCEMEIKKCESMQSELDKMASDRSEIEVYSRSLQMKITDLETEKAKVCSAFKNYRESIEEQSFVLHEHNFNTEELQADFKKQTNVMQTDLEKMKLELAEKIKDLNEEKKKTLEYQAKFEEAEKVKSSLKATAEMESETNMKLRGKLEKYRAFQIKNS